MNMTDAIELAQRMSAAGFTIKDNSLGGWYIMQGQTKYGECSSLEGVQGWFSCWTYWVLDDKPAGEAAEA